MRSVASATTLTLVGAFGTAAPLVQEALGPTCQVSSNVQEAQMFGLRKITSAAVLCATAAAPFMPTMSFAGVMTITDRASISLWSPADQVDWRAYPHRHHRWHAGWHYGWPGFRYGIYSGPNPAGAIYDPAAPVATYGPACGVYGAAYPTCGPYGHSTDYGSGDGGGFVGF